MSEFFRNGVRLLALSRRPARRRGVARDELPAPTADADRVSQAGAAPEDALATPAVPAALPTPAVNVPATAAALLPSSSPCFEYKDGVGNYKALYERVTKRAAVNRERAHLA